MCYTSAFALEIKQSGYLVWTQNKLNIMYNAIESKEPNSGLKAFRAISDITSAYGLSLDIKQHIRNNVKMTWVASYLQKSFKQIDNILEDALNDLLWDW